MLDTFNQHYAKLYALNSTLSVLQWDQEVMMPSKGLEMRANQVSCLSMMNHELKTDPKFIDAMKALYSDTKTPTNLKNAIRRLLRESKQAQNVPSSLVAEMSELQVTAHETWKDARQKSDFLLFKKDLARLIELKKKYGECIRESASQPVYEALLSEYEPDFPMSKMNELFSSLRKDYVPLVSQIVDKAKSRKIRTDINYTMPIADQYKLNLEVLKQMHFDLEAGRLDTAVHPFCSGTWSDVRLTTRYELEDWTNTISSVMHEGGHGLYEQGFGRKFGISPLAYATSLGLHESQSRFWENCIGRSREFAELLLKTARFNFKIDEKITVEELHSHINAPEFSYIRVDADEATYNLHILMRYEIEEAIFRGDLAVSDIPSAWNEKVVSYLKLEKPQDKNGCLQDVHWSGGSFGYFPTYTIGNLISAQLLFAIRKSLKVTELISKGNLAPIKDWLFENVHSKGCGMDTLDIVKEATGDDLSTAPFIAYMKEKFL